MAFLSRFCSLKILYLSLEMPTKFLQLCAASTSTTTQTISSTRKTFSHIFQECSNRRALKPGKEAHAHMILSGFTPTVFVTNCLIQMYVKCCALEYAYKVFEEMPQRDIVSWNTMVFGCAGAGRMELAQAVFNSMPHHGDVVSWNSLISGYLQNGDIQKSIAVFLKMRDLGVMFDHTTLAVSLKICSLLEDQVLGIQIHDKNWISWSAAIAGCVQNDQLLRGLKLFKEMQRKGIGVSQSTYASVFRSCAGLSASRLGTQLHCHALKTDFGSDVIVGTATLDMYAKCDNMSDAYKLFSLLPDHNLQSYNAMIIGYARNEQGFQAFKLFLQLQKNSFSFDEVSLSGALSAAAVIKGHSEGLQLHGLAIKSNLSSNICVANAILDMYGKCGALVEASGLFDEMEIRDPVSWNAIITACEQNESEGKTLSHFGAMLRSKMEPDEFTYGSVLKACAGQRAFSNGMEVHGRIIKSGMGLKMFVGSALVDMYSKCGMMEEAEKIHYRLEEQTMVSWNAIISGFSLQKKSEDSQRFFSHMLEMGVEPDNFTYATVLDTCANLATVGLGKQIHAQMIKLELLSDVYITSTLVDMYSKCGNMHDSLLMFRKAPKRDSVTWNAMICGFAYHGLGEEALELFEHMLHENIKPNHATFVSVLRACSHVGNAKKGLFYFQKMASIYALEPQLEHYSCMVDILGRSGQVEEALRLIQDMPFEADAIIWRTLLSICKIQGNVEVAEKAASSLLKLDPEDSSAYTLLSNIYADAGMWQQVSKIRQTMRSHNLKKEPGCSWIEVKDEVHTFLVCDKAHPKCEMIYSLLDLLICDMRRSGCAPEIDTIQVEEVEENRHQKVKSNGFS
ncbi:pentatricopeptide repeat-containing protein At3g02330, mitochondrial isoform X2 [Cucumis sativus]|uniref:pentatricopeptide repeat-containing protein At3g02330, mitochondrial isoform X2 n=1 Tax=Cucumis sativus TaxID=3659 RepID=UPI0005ED2BF3|nr:pentatricopeptide repeat-containing protein At3g02330, mitochondrial isoform X2 [Cucumis sativus]